MNDEMADQIILEDIQDLVTVRKLLYDIGKRYMTLRVCPNLIAEDITNLVQDLLKHLGNTEIHISE